MYRILLAVDENEGRARRQADYVVTRPGAESVVVSVVHSWSGAVDQVPEENVGTQTIDHVASVRAVTGLFDEADVDYEVIDGAGDPADLVLDVAEDVDADEIVLGRGERSPVGKALFGSVAQNVLLNANVPVVVVGPRET